MGENNRQYQDLAAWLREAGGAVAFTGAGISTESGIPDFRSPGGVWANNRQIYFDDFLAHPEARYEYWRQKCEVLRGFAQARPNAGHQMLAKWESDGRLRAVVTQNIDELHQAAGNRRVLELHGTARKICCLDCGALFEAEALVECFFANDAVPNCPTCSTGRLKHATISFGQPLPDGVMREAIELFEEADLVLALGSSLVVEPAASLPRLAKSRGARLVIVNRDPTGLDDQADLILRDSIGEVLCAVDRALSQRD